MVLLNNKIKNKIKNDLLLVDPESIPNFRKGYIASQDEKDKNIEALEEQIKPASYNIRVGSKYIKEGKNSNDLKKYDSLIIEPFEVAIIETYEKINMPLDMIARWNIRVKLAYEGLVWVGGPQVDPGYCGHLYCPIYNLSDKSVKLEYQEGLATIDFEQTTKPIQSFKGFNKDTPPFEFYKKYKLKSALTTHVQKKIGEIDLTIDEYKKNMDIKHEKMEERLHKLQTTFLTIIGALFATLSILIISMKDDGAKGYGYTVYFAIGISIFSLLMQKNDFAPWYKNIVNVLGYTSIIIIFIFMVFKL